MNRERLIGIIKEEVENMLEAEEKVIVIPGHSTMGTDPSVPLGSAVENLKNFTGITDVEKMIKHSESIDVEDLLVIIDNLNKVLPATEGYPRTELMNALAKLQGVYNFLKPEQEQELQEETDKEEIRN